MYFAGLEPAIAAIQGLQPTYVQTARTATSITSTMELLNGILTRVVPGRVSVYLSFTDAHYFYAGPSGRAV